MKDYRGKACSIVVCLDEEEDILKIYSFLGKCNSSRELRARLLVTYPSGKKVKSPVWLKSCSDELCNNGILKYRFNINLEEIRSKDSYSEEYEEFKTFLGI